MKGDYRLGVTAALCAVLVLAGARVPAQTPAPGPLPPCLQPGKPLLNPPVIRSYGGKLKATLKNVDGKRTLWGSDGDNRCASQNLRYFVGYGPTGRQPWPAGPDPLPGPTFRAQLGDLVEITFFNQVDPKNFSASLDRGTIGTMEACDQFTMGHSGHGSTTGSAGGDTMPDCLHGSSTTNVHFHGTHTTPSTTGDNVLVFIRPSLRVNGQVLPSESQTNGILSQFFSRCEARRPSAKAPWPKVWADMPAAWVKLQASLLRQYDSMPAYNGEKVPPGMQLSPVDEQLIKLGLWPQYQLGANPYCFTIPKYDGTMRMGQSPGTHWYHAHKHGSTALNVANGMTGVFIIEGPYDKQLHAYYSRGLREQVLMIQQLSTAPFPLTDPRYNQGPPGAPRPRISVNGRLDPVVTMQPGEVQMWRIVNGAFRDAIQFAYFKLQPPNLPGNPPASPQCDPATAPTPAPTVQWRQIAQDGVQFAVANYRSLGAANNPFNLAPANRADLLVQAPAQAGSYALCIVRNSALLLDTGTANPASPGAFPRPPSVLLTVTVGGAPVSPAVSFVPDAQFPTQPKFLSDITSSEIKQHRVITFGAGDSTIDGHPFIDGHIDQQMLLNTAEEWVVKNDANDKSHPFHIHINPFQVLEVFAPNDPTALNKLMPDGKPNPCYVDPTNPDTFDPARPTFKDPCSSRVLPGPWVWWDTFPIPTSRTISLDAAFCGTVEACQAKLGKQYSVTCAGSPVVCSVLVDGWFRLRSRFVDFTGLYVLHCHILIHEDRGMMQLIEVTATKPTTSTSPYTHH